MFFRFLSKILENDDVITSSLYASVFSSIYVAGEVGLDTVLDFFSDNYAAILDVYVFTFNKNYKAKQWLFADMHAQVAC